MNKNGFSLILMLIASIMFCDLFAQQINDSTKITKINKEILVIRRASGNSTVIRNKRIINEFYTDSTSKISEPICRDFFVTNITKYKSYYIITLRDKSQKYYEVVSPKKFKLFGNKIKKHERYTLTLYPCYKMDFKEENTIINYHESYPLFYKNHVFYVYIQYENIYAIPNLNGLYIEEKENNEIPKFDIDKYISISKKMAKTNKVRR